MNSTNLEIHIPAEIAVLSLTIAEKVVLAHIDKFPGCSNNRLAKLIGGTCRGVENLLRRLRRQGYIEQVGKGRARRHRLLFPVDHHIKCGDNDTAAPVVKSHTSCVVQPCDPSNVQSDDTFGDLLLAHGTVDNLVITLPPPPVQNLTGAFSNRVWQVRFSSQSDWLYTLERTSDFQSWTNVSPATSGNATNLFLQDANPPADKAFYRVSASRP